MMKANFFCKKKKVSGKQTSGFNQLKMTIQYIYSLNKFNCK